MSLEVPGGSSQPYQDVRLARVEPKSLILPDVPVRQRFFIPTDLLTSRYGVLGFVLLDTRPEQRMYAYDGGEGYVTMRSTPYDVQEDRVRRAHFEDTDTGFKMFRYFMMPDAVTDFFRSTRYLNEGLIEMCTRDPFPEEMDEIPARPFWAFGTSLDQTGIDNINRFINAVAQQAGIIAPGQDEKRLSDNNQRIYVSFHAWENLKEVIAEATTSIEIGLDRFDELLGMHDKRGVLIRRISSGGVPSELPTILE